LLDDVARFLNARRIGSGGRFYERDGCFFDAEDGLVFFETVITQHDGDYPAWDDYRGWAHAYREDWTDDDDLEDGDEDWTDDDDVEDDDEDWTDEGNWADEEDWAGEGDPAGDADNSASERPNATERSFLEKIWDWLWN